MQPIVIYGQFINMYTWVYETIHSWWPELDLYMSSMPAVFAPKSVMYTFAKRPLVSLLESQPVCLLSSLLVSTFESLLGSPLEGASRGNE
jgi:hypothetical protein